MDSTYAGRCLTTLILLLYYMEWTTSTQDTMPVVGEICIREEFEPRCGENEVIVIEYATYGRMQLGRCITNDFGQTQYMGCQTSVLDLLHQKCSGRRDCSLRLPDPDFEDTNPCNTRDLSNYLEASYNCLQVVTGSERDCGDSGEVLITSPSEGYLSSLTTQETGCGDAEHPWVIRAEAGQNVVIKLTDFAHAADELSISGTCTVYAVVKEPSAQTTKTICGGQEMDQVVYQSIGNTVEVQVRPSDDKFFLLHYQFIGCTEPSPAVGLTFFRQGNSGQWKCRDSDIEWTVRCEGTSWVGEPRDCAVTVVKPVTTERSQIVPVNDVSTPVSSFSWKMVLILVAIVTVGMVACVLIIAIVCLKRSRARGVQHPVAQYPLYEVYDMPVPRRVSERDVPQAYYQSLPKDYHSKKTYSDNTVARDGRYDKPVWERPLPRPPGRGEFDA